VSEVLPNGLELERRAFRGVSHGRL
jgi:hypothetical protein